MKQTLLYGLDMFVTDNFSDNQSQKSGSFELERLRQEITNIEYVFDITMPGTFTMEALMEDGDIISKAIIGIRKSRNQFGQDEYDNVLEYLRLARQNLQLAIDEFATLKNKKPRYQYIAFAAENLRWALSYWSVH